MVIHQGDTEGKQLAERIRTIGCEVTEQPAVWPGFFTAIHQPYSSRTFHRPADEQPELVIVDATNNPSVAREIAGYLGETAFTRHIPVFIVNHPGDEAYKAKRRAPNASLYTIGEIEQYLVDKVEPPAEDEDEESAS